MAVTIMVMGIEATVRGLEWSCADEELRLLLEQFSREAIRAHGYVPNYDELAALLATQALHGQVTHKDPPEPTVPGRIY